MARRTDGPERLTPFPGLSKTCVAPHLGWPDGYDRSRWALAAAARSSNASAVRSMAQRPWSIAKVSQPSYESTPIRRAVKFQEPVQRPIRNTVHPTALDAAPYLGITVWPVGGQNRVRPPRSSKRVPLGRTRITFEKMAKDAFQPLVHVAIVPRGPPRW